MTAFTGFPKTKELEAEVSLPAKLQLTEPVELAELDVDEVEPLSDVVSKAELEGPEATTRLRLDLRCSLAVAWQCFNILTEFFYFMWKFLK